MQRYFVDQAVAVDPREEKLPAWVREKLNTMRRAAQQALDEIDGIKGGGKPGQFWLESWHDNGRFYLPMQSGRLMFGNPGGEAILMLSAGANGRPDGWLNINGQSGAGLLSAPWASNVMLVKTSDGIEID